MIHAQCNQDRGGTWASVGVGKKGCPVGCSGAQELSVGVGGDFTILGRHAAFAWQRNTLARGCRSGGEVGSCHSTDVTSALVLFIVGYVLPHLTLIKGEEPQTARSYIRCFHSHLLAEAC